MSTSNSLYQRWDSNPHEQSSTDFLTTMVFTTFTVCGLDYTFTIFFNLGVPRLVSTRSLSGFARYYHLIYLYLYKWHYILSNVQLDDKLDITIIDFHNNYFPYFYQCDGHVKYHNTNSIHISHKNR